MKHTTRNTVPNRLHLACRKHVTEIKWLVPPKLNYKTLQYRASMAKDITGMSEEAVGMICNDGKAAMWIRNMAAAELLFRKKNGCKVEDNVFQILV